MKNIIYKKLKSEKGAIDKVLVTLLMVVIALAGLIGIEQWHSGQKDFLTNKSNTSIQDVINK